MEMAEGLLLGDDHDVQAGGEGLELLGFGAGEGAAGRRCERVAGVLQGVLEVRRVEIDFVGGEDFELMLLERESGEGPARRSSATHRDTSLRASRGWLRSRVWWCRRPAAASA